MLICSTIFLENEAIVISGTQKAVKVAKKVFRKVKMDTCMSEEDLELSQDNVAIGEWHQWHRRQDALQDQVRIEGGCQDRLGGRRQAP